MQVVYYYYFFFRGLFFFLLMFLVNSKSIARLRGSTIVILMFLVVISFFLIVDDWNFNLYDYISSGGILKGFFVSRKSFFNFVILFMFSIFFFQIFVCLKASVVNALVFKNNCIFFLKFWRFGLVCLSLSLWFFLQALLLIPINLLGLVEFLISVIVIYKVFFNKNAMVAISWVPLSKVTLTRGFWLCLFFNFVGVGLLWVLLEYYNYSVVFLKFNTIFRWRFLFFPSLVSFCCQLPWYKSVSGYSRRLFLLVSCGLGLWVVGSFSGIGFRLQSRTFTGLTSEGAFTNVVYGSSAVVVTKVFTNNESLRLFTQKRDLVARGLIASGYNDLRIGAFIESIKEQVIFYLNMGNIKAAEQFFREHLARFKEREMAKTMAALAQRNQDHGALQKALDPAFSYWNYVDPRTSRFWTRTLPTRVVLCTVVFFTYKWYTAVSVKETSRVRAPVKDVSRRSLSTKRETVKPKLANSKDVEIPKTVLPEQVDAEFSVLAFRDTGVGSPMNCLPVNPSDATSRPRLTESVAIPSSMSSVLPKAGEVSSRLSEPECLVVLEVSDSGVGRVIDLSQNKYLPRVKVSRRPEVSPVEVKRPDVRPIVASRPASAVIPDVKQGYSEASRVGLNLPRQVERLSTLKPKISNFNSRRLEQEYSIDPPILNPGTIRVKKKLVKWFKEIHSSDSVPLLQNTNKSGQVVISLLPDHNIVGLTNPGLSVREKHQVSYSFIENISRQNPWYRYLDFSSSISLYEAKYLTQMAEVVAKQEDKRLPAIALVRHELLTKYGQELRPKELFKYLLKVSSFVQKYFAKVECFIDLRP